MTKSTADRAAPGDGALASHRGLASTIVAAAVQPGSGGNHDDDATRTADGSVVPTPEPADPPPPGRLPAPLQTRDPERYDVLGEHGRGGLGKVARAYDKELGRQVAIKELLKRGDAGEIRFLREALITARLEHPGIVPLHEAGRWPDGTPFYVMKLVAGRSLKELIEERATVEGRLELLHHVIAVADALAYAHKRKIIHRDLKPANVIAGDFGETIVIDWGLAKDLSATDDAAGEASPYRGPASSDLTEAGSVLGTPMYMAPEQWRGEPVDQRADVFAIGAMLWELCSLQRVPPADARQRDRMLRQNGIDRDLAAIVAKALAPDPRHRYRDAGELARDLRAFKSGARIGARRYTPLAVIAHWTRRHRAVAATITAALVLGLAGAAVYVRAVTAERDRADSSAVEAQLQRRAADQAKEETLLQNAELLVARNPTAAATVLERYRGPEQVRQKMLQAEARGRGVATIDHAPHSDTIMFLTVDRSGAIISVGEDRRIRATVNTTTITLASDVSPVMQLAHTRSGGRLAYARSPSGIGILNIDQRTTSTLDLDAHGGVSLSPSGNRLSALSRNNTLVIWDITSARALHTSKQTDLIHTVFANDGQLLLVKEREVRLLSFDTHPTTEIAAPLATRMADARGADIAIAELDGRITFLAPDLNKISTQSVCKESVNNIRLSASASLIAFTCSDKTAGIARYNTATKLMYNVDTFPTDGNAMFAIPSDDGRWVAAFSDSDIGYAYDVDSKLLTRLYGQGARISRAAPPSVDLASFVFGDIDGRLRVYPLPDAGARLVLRAGSSLLRAVFSPDGKHLAVAGRDAIVRLVDVSTGESTELPGHSAPVLLTRFSPDGSTLASLSVDGTARVWETSSRRLRRAYSNPTSMIQDMDYIDSGRRIVSASDNGRLSIWDFNLVDDKLFTHPRPLAALEVLQNSGDVVAHDDTGTIWKITLQGKSAVLRDGDGVHITALRASPDGALLAVGTELGQVQIIDTQVQKRPVTMKLPGSISRIEFHPKNQNIIVTTEPNGVHILGVEKQLDLPWTHVPHKARDIAYHPSGDMVAISCTDGGIWLYDFPSDKWFHFRNHTSMIMTGVFDKTGQKFASADSAGNLIIRDIRKIKENVSQ